MSKKLQILYLVKDPPYEPRSHAGQRARSMISEWAASKEARVTFVFPGKVSRPRTLNSASGFEISSARTLIEKVFGLLLPYHFRLLGKAFADKTLRQIGGLKFDVIVAEELTMGEQGISLSRRLGIPLFYIAHNFEAYLYKQIADEPLSSIKLGILRFKEARVLRLAKRTFAFSREDAERLKTAYPGKAIHVTSAGFDLQSTTFMGPTSETSHLLIIGALDYQPNIECVQWFAEKIYPLLSKRYPVIVAGRNPAHSVRTACMSHGFELIADPPDMNPILSRGALELVPLKKGSGTRGKILEAMASGIPVVSTTLGCEGLGLEHDTHLIIADTEKEFAASIDHLMSNDRLRNKVAQNAYKKVQQFSYSVVARELIVGFTNDL